MAIKNRENFVCPPPVPPTVDWFPRDVKRRGQVIAHLARHNKWRRGAELGLWEGATMDRVLRDCPRISMIGVDLWKPQPRNPGPEGYEGWDHDKHEATCRTRLGAYGDRATIIKGRTVAAAKQVEDGTLDFVFIDADHSERAVRADIRAWGPKLKPGGWMMGHDVNWDGVRAAVDDLVPGYWIGPDVVWGRVWQPA